MTEDRKARLEKARRNLGDAPKLVTDEDVRVILNLFGQVQPSKRKKVS